MQVTMTCCTNDCIKSVLIACTRLYKPLCRSVGRSVGSQHFTFLLFFSQLSSALVFARIFGPHIRKTKGKRLHAEQHFNCVPHYQFNPQQSKIYSMPCLQTRMKLSSISTMHYSWEKLLCDLFPLKWFLTWWVTAYNQLQRGAVT